MLILIDQAGQVMRLIACRLKAGNAKCMYCLIDNA